MRFELGVKFRKMVSIPKALLFTFLFFITVTEGGKKKNTEKIVIHVPYKILKHHHTHTKYKVITIPAPKKEDTIIYLKEIQPTLNYIPQMQTHPEITETQHNTPKPFTPPHQESAPALLESLANHKKESSVQADQQEEYTTIKDDQKPLKSNSEQTSTGFVPSFPYKHAMLNPHENVIPNFSFNPVIPVIPKQHVFTPKLLINPIYHPSYDSYFPKFNYQPMLHLSQGHFGQNYMFKQKLPPTKVFHDNIAHASNEVYKTIMSPRMKTTSYQVKEETEEEPNMQSVRHLHTTSNAVPVPSLKTNRRGKNHLQPGQNYQLKNLIPSHPEYEYEHIGYLIIDGKSKKIVGKNFKDQIHLSR